MRKFALVLTVLLSLSPGQALADSVVFTFDTGSGATNHSYQFISGQRDWNLARTAANANQLLDGTNGYLVTITTQAENDFLWSKFGILGSNTSHVWTGATDKDEEGNWRWVTGNTTQDNGTSTSQFWSGGVNGSSRNGLYQSWAPSEPNDSFSADYMEWNAGNFGAWNDIQSDPPNNVGYFVEFDSLNPIPEPTTALLLTLGFAGLGMKRREGASR